MTDRRWADLFVLIPLGILMYFAWDGLTLPFYWDAAWVYAPGIKSLGADFHLFPTLESIEYSRGHPQLFFVLGAIWTWIFGDSNLALHSYSLSISVALVLSFYFVLKRHTSSPFAVIGTVLLSLQQALLAQSALLLPEVFLALGIMWTIHFWIKSQWVAYAIAGSLSVLIKESAWVIVMLLPLLSIVQHFLQNKIVTLQAIFAQCTPIFTIGLFLLYNYLRFDWWLYPEHTGMVQLNSAYIKQTFQRAYTFTFELQGRELFLYIGISLMIFFRKQLPVWERILHFLLLGAVVKVVFDRLPFLDGYGLLLLIPLAIFSWYRLIFPLFRKGSKETLIAVIATYLIAFVLFSSLNFYTARYLLNAIVLFLLGGALAIHEFAFWRPYMTWIMPAAAGLALVVSLSGVRHNLDINLGYRDSIEVTQAFVDYMVEQAYFDKDIAATFLDNNNLNGFPAGYRTDGPLFQSVQGQVDKGVELVLFGNLSAGIHKEDLAGFELEKRWESGTSWTELYRRKL
jgi:hypothetical protein